MKATVKLVGAGPGDPELLTVKALKAIWSADVILYDALANKEILDHARPDCKLVFVGKRSGMKRYAQPEINEIMINYALTGLRVVRLKGGDPTVFGRCYEEVDSLREKGIEVEIVPGISSALGIAAGLQIPLTKRGVSSSIWIVTATDLNDSTTNDLELALQSGATVVILMGMRRLPEIAANLVAQGRAELPMAVIQNGTRPDEKSVYGTAASIVGQCRMAEIGTPAIILAGNAIAEARESVNLTTLNYAQQTLPRLHQTG